MDKEEFLKRRAEIQAHSNQLWDKVEEHQEEENRVINVLHNSEQILNRLDLTFEQRTSLTKTDSALLMLATSLQLIRIYFLPKFKEKYLDENRLQHDADLIQKMEKEEIDKYKKNHIDKWETKEGSKKYRTWQEIAFTRKVPYDATAAANEDFGYHMHGKQHRVKTLGHDPVLGWIFGVANIITDTITVCPEYSLGEKKYRIPYIRTFNVNMRKKELGFCWTDQTTNRQMFKDCRASIKEDKHRLYAALFAQGLHLASDKYTKCGLPIPFLSLIDSDKAYEIYQEGYDYLDYLYDTQLIKQTLKSASYAILINLLIGCIHKFFYNPKTDYNKDLYNVRTRKIILYSNLIATTSDVVQTAIRSYNGDENALKNFDLGGFLVTLYRLITDTSFIMKIKEEFIFNEWDRIMDSKDNIFNI